MPGVLRKTSRCQLYEAARLYSFACSSSGAGAAGWKEVVVKGVKNRCLSGTKKQVALSGVSGDLLVASFVYFFGVGDF